MPRQSSHAFCAVCGALMAFSRHNWLLRCRACGFLASTLSVPQNPQGSALDEAARAVALHTLRFRNFNRVLTAMAEAGLAPTSSILDVGCGHGWFVQLAAERGYAAVGLEPDQAIATVARHGGAPVRSGFFPDALDRDERFDAIVFNDVFEHLPDPQGALLAARDRLNPQGLAVINLPVASGVLYRLADQLDRIGIRGPFERMWQKAFPSPHLSYFTQPQLARLAARCGFVERARGTLASLEAKGLWARLRYDRTATVAASALVWMAIRPTLPLLAMLPADIGLQIFAPTPLPARRT